VSRDSRAAPARQPSTLPGRRSALALLTPLATWTGFVYVAFVIDAYARRIVSWRASRTAHAGFVLDALEQALPGGAGAR
jgi:putative transposase